MIERSVTRVLQYIYEMARERAKAEEKVRSFCNPITNHLIKILKWKDPKNYHKHIDDINVFISKSYDFRFNKKKKFSKQEYFEFLFEDRINDLEDLKRIIRFQLTSYHKLPIIRSDEEVYIILKRIMFIVCNDLVDKKFKGVEYYISELPSS